MNISSIRRSWFLITGAITLVGLLGLLLVTQLQAHVGSVEDVVIDLKRYEALGVTHMGLRMRWAGMDVEPTAKCMRLVAEQVMPHFL